MPAKAQETALAKVSAKDVATGARLAKSRVEARGRRLAKEAIERQDSKEWWDRIERLGSKFIESGLVKTAAGAVAGGLSLIPTSIEMVEKNLREFHTIYGAPGDDRNVSECRSECYRRQREGRHSVDWLLQCLEDCGDPVPPVVLGVDQTWWMKFRIYVNLHIIVPDFQMDIPGWKNPWTGEIIVQPTNFDVRKTLAFYVEYAATEFQPVAEPDAEFALRKVRAKAESQFRWQFPLFGAMAGANADLFIRIFTGGMTALGEMMKGIGEIVPG